MSYRLPIIGRCRVTVTISVKKLHLRQGCEANPVVNRETTLGRPLASAKTTRAADRARAVQAVTDGIAYPLRETQPTEVDFTAAGIELQS
jgi:hypothetical protein